MATTVTLNGVGYDIPALGEDGWGDDVSGYLIASATGLLSKAGGTFTLTADVDFGATYGLKSQYFKSAASNIATTGRFRLANADTGIVWRNAANSADLALTVNSSNALTFGGSSIIVAGSASIVNADISASAAIDFSKLAALTAGNVLLGNASNVPTSTALSGDVTVNSSGVTAIGSGVIVDADVSGSAAIAYSKLNLATSIVNADVSGSAAIAYSKLNLASSIVNADVSGSAAIAYSKLNLATSIVNADVATAAAIAGTKIAPDFGSQNVATTGVISAGATTITTPGQYNAKNTSTSITGYYVEATGSDADVTGIRMKNDVREWAVIVKGSQGDSFTIRDITGTSDRLYLSTSGVLTLGGYLAGVAQFDASGVVSSSRTVSADAISFPSTQVSSAGANTLDDYEEGTWTPTITPASGSGITYTSRVGLYTKVGNMVTLSGHIIVSGLGTASGLITITLPFTAVNISDGYHTVQVGYWANMTTSVNAAGGYVTPNTATLRITRTTAAATGLTSILTIADISATTDIIFSTTILTAT